MAQQRVVRLLKNQIYPTYQLYAVMDSKKTKPMDGLRLAALITMEWLGQRLGENAPEVFAQIPAPDRYQEVSEDALPSMHLNCGFVIDIVSMPKQGLWTLQITEPDLGSDPGNADQARAAVPGRVIETNVAFHVNGQELECGFQTVISDPVNASKQAEVYRLAIVRRLVDHPDFGLRQITRLQHGVDKVDTAEQLKKLLAVWHDAENQLPCVVFTHPRTQQEEAIPQLPFPMAMPPQGASLRTYLPEAAQRPMTMVQKPPYDLGEFARYGVTYCRTYLLQDALLEWLNEKIKEKVQPGDIVVLEPGRFGGAVRLYPYKISKLRQKETFEALKKELYAYSRDKTVSFGGISFLSAARERLLCDTTDALEQSASVSTEWQQKLMQLDKEWKAALDRKDEECHALTQQLERQREYQARLEAEKAELRAAQKQKEEDARRQLAGKDAEIVFLRRKLSQPREHQDIAAWVEQHFAGRLLLHPKAVALLEDRSAREINIGLICDALDFLATDYWACRYQQITADEMKTRCSQKYGRPFEVKPTGTATIEFTPAQYKVKYFLGAAGKPVESALDYHLGVGNDPENLLRIYFLHDDAKKLIVVGSLPRHLRAVTIK